MIRWFLLALLALPAAAQAQYFDGLPVAGTPPAAALGSADIVPICQGGTAGRPGTCKPARTTVGALQTPLGALDLKTWATAGRPSTPVAGAIGFNTDLSSLDVYSGSAWVNGTTFLGGAVPNATTFESTLTATGLATLSGGGTFGGNWSGALNLTASGTALAVTNNATVGGTETLGGTLSQTGTRAWSAGFPGTNNLGLYQSLTLTGTPTAGSGEPSGTIVPFNALDYSDQLNLGTTGYQASVLDINHTYGGGSTDGSRATLLVQSQLHGSMGADNPYQTTATVVQKIWGNLTGAVSGTGVGNFVALNTNQLVVSGSYPYEVAGGEMDFTAQSGSTVNYFEFLKLVNMSPAAWSPSTNGAFLRFATETVGTTGTLQYGLYFGDPQAGGGGFPISSTGTEIWLGSGTAGIGIDGSSATYNTAFIKGPSGFQVDNNSVVHSNGTDLASGTTWSLLDQYGLTDYFQVQGAASTVNYLLVKSAATGSAPSISAIGTDTNVDLNFLTQGTGTLEVNGTPGVTSTTCTQWTSGLCTHS